MKENDKKIMKDADKSLIPAATGELILSKDKKRIEVDLKLKVSDLQFTYTGYSYVVEANGFKGIVFSYYHTGNPSTCDYKPINHSSPQIPVKETVNHPSFVNLSDKDKEVRIMLLNEEDEQQFTDMEDYFIKYLTTFEYRSVTSQDFDDYNDEWNNNNPTRAVNIDCSDKPIIVPRFTKDGGVLTLKFRR
ncbi:hypothetical protein [Flavobacterium litorale]|uniref:Uncharacterized protein n=1 Tax=Flavobacterium litorale TaxID=2856519 RepID=A0ABX8V6Z7_9FLAO|nr:hypothetical protein [Flavobacterium litorale]QYJ68614.1 hypothetical protein K1I41_01675 [Flavobacterium litorale]